MRRASVATSKDVAAQWFLGEQCASSSADTWSDIGGPADLDGRTVLVDLAADRYYPFFLGIEGSNYILDRSWDIDPGYARWPPGAGEPVDRWQWSATAE